MDNYTKDFKSWHSLKEKIDKNNDDFFFYEREMWFCSLGVNVGQEQDGRGEKFSRPILVLKKFNNNLFWGIPLTSKNKKNKYYLEFSHNNQKYSAIFSQIRIFDKKRLLRKIGYFPKDKFEELKNKISIIINKTTPR